jgi:NADH:ubiquinone oxidoreductase subunit B-like Fe-S oxidoreductase
VTPLRGFQLLFVAAGVNWVIPVEFYVPASPQWPEQLLHAIAFLQETTLRERRSVLKTANAG